MTPEQRFRYADERFADLQMLRYQVRGFEHLSLRQKKLIYFLAEAALTGRDILWDQNGRYNLRIRRLLEAVYTDYPGDRTTPDFLAFETYLKRVWFSNGIHHHYSCDKFRPAFSPDFLRNALKVIHYNGEETALCTENHSQRPVDAALSADPATPSQRPVDGGTSAVDALCDELFPIIFDPAVLPKRVNQAFGQDLVQTSAANYYAPDITQKEAEAFYQQMKDAAPDPAHPVMFGMNSRLVKEQGLLREDVWRNRGLYGMAIERIIYWLQQASTVAENQRQADVINKLIEFYRTGDLLTFDEYTILWVQETEGLVDFVNGFTESYGDPLGMKASWEGFANFKDNEATARTERLAANAQWFEDHSPVDDRFKKENCRGITAKVIIAAMLGGDLYPASAIGINLPNSNWVRAEHGSKSVTIGNLTEAYNQAARGNGFREEFVVDEPTQQLIDAYGDVCDDLHTDLHECLGHGSGKLLPGVDPDALKAYGSTIEEARADLFGLYYIADQKLVELKLTPNAEAYKSQYYTYLMNGLLTQLVRIEPGKNIEEAHMRNRALIAHWVLEQASYCAPTGTQPAVQLIQRDGKTFVQINDYPTLRQLFGRLLAEIQRIKSEGDYDAAQRLVEDYAVKVNPTLHDEILTRYRALNLAPYKGFINPQYIVHRDHQGNITDISLRYDESFAQQMLRYSRDYNTLPLINE